MTKGRLLDIKGGIIWTAAAAAKASNRDENQRTEKKRTEKKRNKNKH